MSYDVEAVRQDFPILSTEVHGRPLVFLDTGASAQKPQAVIDRIAHFYANDYANIHRGVYELSQRATEAHEGAREKVRAFINAAERSEIIFTRSATESFNLVAHSYVRAHSKPGDRIVITAMEHHANIVPWQMLCDECGVVLHVLPVSEDGTIDLLDLDRALENPTCLVSVTWVSNVLGTVNPVRDIIAKAKLVGVPVMLDAAQAVQHMAIDVQALDCDFLAFSGHKLYGPTGIGVLFGKKALLEAMPPYQGGGDMIRTVSFEGTQFNDVPLKFEAGTPDIVGAVALGEAIDYVNALGLDAIAQHEADLLNYAERALKQVEGLKIIGGAAPERCSVISFVMKDAHPHDLGTVLDLDGIAVRTGQHCAEPIVTQLTPHAATVRVSLGLYNNEADIDALVKGLNRAAAMFA